GNLYGTAVEGGNSSCYSSFGCGTVYKLTHQGSGWIFNLLYTFNGDNDGVYPRARVIFGPNSTLYGTTEEGGNPSCNAPYGCGTVFNLRPSPTACKTALCPWTETVLYRFAGGADGAFPAWGDL